MHHGKSGIHGHVNAHTARACRPPIIGVRDPVKRAAELRANMRSQELWVRPFGAWHARSGPGRDRHLRGTGRRRRWGGHGRSPVVPALVIESARPVVLGRAVAGIRGACRLAPRGDGTAVMG
jgi:hypothetical protein